MSLPLEKKEIWTHDDIFGNEPFLDTVVIMHRNYAIGMHTHAFYEVNIVLSGEGTHYIESNKTECSVGAVYVIPPRVMHGYEKKSEMDVFHILLHERFMTRFKRELDAAAGFRMLFDIEPLLRSSTLGDAFLVLSPEELDSLAPFTEEMLRVNRGNVSERIMQSGLALYYVTRLCSFFAARHGEKSETGKSESHSVMKSVEWLQRNYMYKISADDLVARTYLSRSSFFRLFRKLFSMTPGEYLTEYRLREAKSQLRLTDKTVGEIALDCGFFDPSHFIRRFEKAEGMSPSRYRLSLTQDP